MGASAHLYVDGVKPPDEKYRKMKAVWDSCREAKLDIPKAVLDYFELKYEPDGSCQEEPLADGVRVRLIDVSPDGDYSVRGAQQHPSVTTFDEAHEYQAVKVVLVDLEKLPEDIKQLRLAVTLS
jgi:hypothetical protein